MGHARTQVRVIAKLSPRPFPPCLFRYFAPLILSLTHWSTTLARFSGGRLLAPCSVSIQHCSAALYWVSGGGAASAAGVAAGLVLQLARITAPISRRFKGATLVRATVQDFIANVRPEVFEADHTNDFRGYRKSQWSPDVASRRHGLPFSIPYLNRRGRFLLRSDRCGCKFRQFLVRGDGGRQFRRSRSRQSRGMSGPMASSAAGDVVSIGGS